MWNEYLKFETEKIKNTVHIYNILFNIFCVKLDKIYNVSINIVLT